MEHSVSAYLRRLPTETLENFLQDYKNDRQKDNFVCVIDDIINELARRNKEKADNAPL